MTNYFGLVKEVEDKFGSINNAPAGHPKLQLIRSLTSERPGPKAKKVNSDLLTNKKTKKRNHPSGYTYKELAVRNKKICELNKLGFGLEAIADRFELSPGMTREVINNSGMQPNKSFNILIQNKSKRIYFRSWTEVLRYLKLANYNTLKKLNGKSINGFKVSKLKNIYQADLSENDCYVEDGRMHTVEKN